MADRRMLRIGEIPMPPARNTAGRGMSVCSVKDPRGRLTMNFVPKAAVFKALLKAVLRMRMAIMIESLSKGELAREKVRELSLSLPKTKSACCLLGIRSGHRLRRTRTPSCPGQCPADLLVSFG